MPELSRAHHDEPLPLLVDKKALARLLSLSVKSIDRHAETGRLPMPLKVGGRRLWRRSEIERWVQAGCPRIVR